jgi:hypothetical protein
MVLRFKIYLCANSWHVATCSDEAQLKSTIVLAVKGALPARRLQHVAPHRVGLEESMKDVIQKLNLMRDSVTRISPKNSNDEVQTLQIGGMMH